MKRDARVISVDSFSKQNKRVLFFPSSFFLISRRRWPGPTYSPSRCYVYVRYVYLRHLTPTRVASFSFYRLRGRRNKEVVLLRHEFYIRDRENGARAPRVSQSHIGTMFYKCQPLFLFLSLFFFFGWKWMEL